MRQEMTQHTTLHPAAGGAAGPGAGGFPPLPAPSLSSPLLPPSTPNIVSAANIVNCAMSQCRNVFRNSTLTLTRFSRLQYDKYSKMDPALYGRLPGLPSLSPMMPGSSAPPPPPMSASSSTLFGPPGHLAAFQPKVTLDGKHRVTFADRLFDRQANLLTTAVNKSKPSPVSVG